MTAEKPAPQLGAYVFGLGIIAIALVSLALGDFHPGQPAPKTFPDRTALAYAAAVLMLAGGAAVEWPRAKAWGAGLLTAYWTLVVVVLMDGRSILRHAHEFLAYSNTAEQLALAAGALIVFAGSARLAPALAAGLTRVGQGAFGVCAVLFGGAHFLYMNLTAPLAPAWLPPSQVFWGQATGVAHIAAGLAILAGAIVPDFVGAFGGARLAAILLTVMFAAFTPLVHLPMLLADPTNHGVWTENVTNLALTGAAWVVADAFVRRPPSGRGPQIYPLNI